MPISVIVSKLRGWLKQNDYLSETISTYDLSRHSLETGPHHKSKPLVKSSIFVSPPLQQESVSITTNVVSSNAAHDKVYSIQYYVIKFVSDLQQVGGFLRILRFPPLIKLTAMIQLKHCEKWQYIIIQPTHIQSLNSQILFLPFGILVPNFF